MVKAPHIRLYGPRQIAIITASLLAGIGFFLFRRYYENGKLGQIELFATPVSLAVFATIVVVIVRKGNRED